MHALARAQECQLTAGHGPRPRARGSVRRLRVSRCKPCSMRRMCMPSHASPHVPGMGDRLQRAALGAAAVPPNLPPGGAAHPCACARASRHVAGASRRAAGALARHRSCVHAATCPSARVFVQRVRVASSHVRAGRTRRSQPGALSSTHARTRARTNALRVQLQTQGCSFPVAAAGAPVAGLMCAPSMRMRCLKAPCSASPCKPSREPFQRRNRRSLYEAGDVNASTLRRALERMGLSV